MIEVFADAGYWIAMTDTKDSLCSTARRVTAELGERGEFRIVTSEMVLVEFLNHFAGGGEDARSVVVDTLGRLRANENVLIVEQTGALFARAVEYYASRRDQRWSLIDCSSFVLMEERGIEDALAHDIDFVQAGFNALLRSD